MSTKESPEPTARILIVEDDLAILKGLSMNLHYEGYQVLPAQNGKAGLQMAIDEKPDLVILDVMLPEMNGYEVLEELRNRGLSFPVLLLTAKGMETDKVLGLNLGADDYVVKPFGLLEILARIKALLRRRGQPDASLSFGDISVQLKAKTIHKGKKLVDLTAQEWRLLSFLVEHKGQAFSRDDLLRGAWGYDYEGTARTVDNFVSSLRQKLEDSPESPRHLVTVRGIGYRFE